MSSVSIYLSIYVSLRRRSSLQSHEFSIYLSTEFTYLSYHQFIPQYPCTVGWPRFYKNLKKIKNSTGAVVLWVLCTKTSNYPKFHPFLMIGTGGCIFCFLRTNVVSATFLFVNRIFLWFHNFYDRSKINFISKTDNMNIRFFPMSLSWAL